MNYLIITSHPYDGSFNAGAAKLIEQTAKEKGHNVCKIDLVADNFNPVMKGEDLKNWGSGSCSDPMVKKYQDEIDNADILVFPFPVWWGTMPAVLKGFCDKVLLPGWAYRYGESGEMIGMLTNKQAIVISTMETPMEVFNEHFQNPVEGGFIKDTLVTCGIKISKFFQIDKIVSGGREYTDSKMNEIKNFIQ